MRDGWHDNWRVFSLGLSCSKRSLPPHAYHLDFAHVALSKAGGGGGGDDDDDSDTPLKMMLLAMTLPTMMMLLVTMTMDDGVKHVNGCQNAIHKVRN